MSFSSKLLLYKERFYLLLLSSEQYEYSFFNVFPSGIELLEQSDWQGRIAKIETQLRNELAPCSKAASVIDVRVLGAIGVVEMKDPVDMSSAQAFFVDRGVWIRPFGKLVYIMPPYVIEADDLTRLTSAIVEFTRR